MLKQLYRKYIKYLDSRSEKIRVRKQWIGERIEIHKMLSSIPVKGKILSKEQKNLIDDYWKTYYGKRISTKWHLKYYAYSGKFDEKYVPEILYTTKIEPLFNPEQIAKTLQDKSLIEYIYAKAINENDNIVIPITRGGCVNGTYFDDKRDICVKHEFIEKMNRLEGKYIIKPAVGGNSGRDVELLCLKNGIDSCSNKKLDDIIDAYGANFIIQDCIVQNEKYAALHANSVNTIRLISYKKDGKIVVAPAIMRIGIGETYIDNTHAGGVYIGVEKNGRLLERGIKQYCEPVFIHPDSRIIFKDYQLPYFERFFEAAKELHKCLPSIGIVNWDFAMNDKNQVVLIESNLICGSIWLIQNAWGKSVFEENTEYILQKIRKK